MSYQGEVIVVTKWKDICGYEGIYQLTKYGQVKSLSRTIIRSNGKLLRLKGQIIKHHLNRGYPAVTLTNCCMQRIHKIHRLLLIYFVCDCPVGMEACHKNDNKLDYSMKNLLWDTRSANQEDRVRNGLNHNKPVMCISDGRIFSSIRKVAENTGTDRKTLSMCLRGIYQIANGFQWQYLNVPVDIAQ